MIGYSKCMYLLPNVRQYAKSSYPHVSNLNMDDSKGLGLRLHLLTILGIYNYLDT